MLRGIDNVSMTRHLSYLSYPKNSNTMTKRTLVTANNAVVKDSVCFFMCLLWVQATRVLPPRHLLIWKSNVLSNPCLLGEQRGTPKKERRQSLKTNQWAWQTPNPNHVLPLDRSIVREKQARVVVWERVLMGWWAEWRDKFQDHKWWLEPILPGGWANHNDEENRLWYRTRLDRITPMNVSWEISTSVLEIFVFPSWSLATILYWQRLIYLSANYSATMKIDIF